MQSASDIVNRIYAFSPEIPDAQMFVLTPPMIPGYGMGNGFELYVQDLSLIHICAYHHRNGNKYRHKYQR